MVVTWSLRCASDREGRGFTRPLHYRHIVVTWSLRGRHIVVTWSLRCLRLIEKVAALEAAATGHAQKTLGLERKLAAAEAKAVTSRGVLDEARSEAEERVALANAELEYQVLQPLQTLQTLQTLQWRSGSSSPTRSSSTRRHAAVSTHQPHHETAPSTARAPPPLTRLPLWPQVANLRQESSSLREELPMLRTRCSDLQVRPTHETAETAETAVKCRSWL